MPGYGSTDSLENSRERSVGGISAQNLLPINEDSERVDTFPPSSDSERSREMKKKKPADFKHEHQHANGEVCDCANEIVRM